MIDDLTLVRDLRPDTTAPDQLTVTRARRALLHRAMEGRRRRRRRVIAMGMVAAAALALMGITPPWSGTTTPAAAALTSAHLADHPEVGADQYLHIRKVQRTWGYGAAGQIDPFMLEYWIPGDGTSTWVERSGEPGDREVWSFDDWGPALYVEHADDKEGLLAQLREYARENGEGTDLHALWTVAFWIALDPVAPESFKTEVMQAISSLEGVSVVDPSFSTPGLTGHALGMDGTTEVRFVVDPRSGAFRGLVGYPEKDRTWIGPEAPMWTLVIESEVVNERPNP